MSIQQSLSRENSKLRVLLIYRWLCSGEELNTRMIIERLSLRYDMLVDRKAIYNDLATIDRVMPLEYSGGRGCTYRKMEG